MSPLSPQGTPSPPSQEMLTVGVDGELEPIGSVDPQPSNKLVQFRCWPDSRGLLKPSRYALVNPVPLVGARPHLEPSPNNVRHPR